MSVSEPTPPSQAYPDPVPGIIEHGSVNLLAGASGVGKTCLTASLLRHLRDGTPMFGHPTHAPTTLGYIGADRTQGSAKRWLAKAGVGEIPYYSLATDAGFSPARLRAKHQLSGILDECLTKLNAPPGALVVVDPVALFLGNLLDYHACAVSLLEIRRLCAKREITLIGLAHAAKQKGDKREQYTRLTDRILGSGAQLGYGDTQMYLAGPSELNTKHYVFMWLPHSSPAEEFTLGRDAEGLFVPWVEGLEAMELDEEQLLALFPELPEDIAFGELVVKAQESRATVHRRLQGLVKHGRVESSAHGRYRRVPVN